MNQIVSQILDSCFAESDKVNEYIYKKFYPYILFLFIFMTLNLFFSIVKITQNAKILSLLKHEKIITM